MRLLPLLLLLIPVAVASAAVVSIWVKKRREKKAREITDPRKWLRKFRDERNTKDMAAWDDVYRRLDEKNGE